LTQSAVSVIYAPRPPARKITLRANPRSTRARSTFPNLHRY